MNDFCRTLQEIISIQTPVLDTLSLNSDRKSKDQDWTLKSQKADVTYVAVESMDEMQWQSKELRVLMFEKTYRLRIC